MKNAQRLLEDCLLLDQHSGQIFMNAPGLDLLFPMLVVRHGETDGNVRRTFQGQADGSENQLNDVGKEQAKQAAKRIYEELLELLGGHLKDVAASGRLIVLKSPMKRAQDTANAFIEHFERQTEISLSSQVEEKLAEICFGDLEGRTLEEVHDQELCDQAVRYRVHQDATVNWKGTGESFLDVLIRVNSLLEHLNTKYYHNNAIVVAFAHGISINALRTVVGDTTLLTDNGMIAYRNRVLPNAQAYWLDRSEQLVQQLASQEGGSENR